MDAQKNQEFRDLTTWGKILLGSAIPQLEAFSENALYCGRGMPTMSNLKTVKEVCSATGLTGKHLYYFHHENIVRAVAYANYSVEGKDNIDEQWIVESIRNNTLLIVYVLLGGYKLTSSSKDDRIELGIIDDSFDRMYRSINQIIRGRYKFILYYPSKAPIKAFRHYIQDLSIYDEYGLLTPSRIRFIETDTFSESAYDQAMQGLSVDKEFYITSQNIPEQISFIDKNNNEIFISW